MPSVDERIVQMEFDNAQFEQGVKESMRSLDALEKSLMFPEGTSGLENIASAIKQINFSTLEHGVDSIADKFSLLGTIGRTVVQNLTNDAVDAIQQIPNIFGKAIEQIKTGGWTRAANLEQARFMLKGLTDDEEKVEKIIVGWTDKLGNKINGPVMAAVNDTRFGLDEAAVAAANLYASGITDMDKLGHSLQAISGAATMTNKEYGDMAQIFSTIASNGFLMTMQVRQFSSYGMNILALLRDYFKETKGITMTEQEIGDGLKDGLVTYETFADAMHKYWKIASEANTTFSGSLANVKAQLSKIGAEIAGVYMDKMIGVNVALIGYLKELKNQLEPIFNIVNTGIENVTNDLAKAISSKILLKETKRIIKSVVNLYNVFTMILKPVGRFFDALFPNGIVKVIDRMVKGFYNWTKSLKSFFETSETGKSILDSLSKIFYTLGSAVGFWIAKWEHTLDTLSPVFEFLVNIAAQILRIGAVIGEIGIEYISAIFEKLYGGVDKGAEAVGGLKKAIEDFLPSADDIKAAGDKIIEVIESIIPGADEVLGKLSNIQGPLDTAKDKLGEVSNRFSSLKDFLSNVVSTILGFVGKIAKGVADGFVKIADSLRDTEGTTISVCEAIGGVLKGLYTYLSPVFDGLLEILRNFVADFDMNTLINVLKTGGLVAIVSELYGMFNKLNTIITKVDLPSALKNAIWEASKALEVMQRTVNASVIKQMAISISILAGSLFVLSLVDSEKLGIALGVLTGAMIELFGAFALFSKLGTLDFTGSSGGFLGNIFGPGLTNAKIFANLIMLASAITIMAGALKLLSSIDDEGLAMGTLAMIDIVLTMIATLKALDLLFAKSDPAKLAAISGTLIILSVALQTMAGAVALFSMLPINQVWPGLITMGVVITGLVVAMEALSKVAPRAIVGAAAIAVVSGSLYLIAGALAIFNQMNPEKTVESLGLIAIALLGEFVPALAILGTIGPAVLAGAGAITLVAGAMVTLAAAMMLFSTIDLPGIVTGLVTLGLSLIAITGALIALSAAGPMALAAGGAILMVSVAMITLAAALKIVSTIPGDKINSIFNLIAGALGILLASALAAMLVLPGLATLAGVFTALSVAALAVGAALLMAGAGFSLMAGGLALLNGVDISKIALGLFDLSGALLLLTASAAVMALFMIPFAAFCLEMVVLAASIGLASIGVAAFATALESIMRLNTKDLVKIMNELSDSFAILSVSGAILLPVAGSLKTIANSMDILSRATPTTLRYIREFSMAARVMTSYINDISFDPFVESFDKVVESVKNSASQLGNLDSLTQSMKTLSDSASTMAPLTEKIDTIAQGMVSLYEKTDPTAIKLGDFVNNIKNLNTTISGISFDDLVTELNEVVEAADEFAKYNTDLGVFKTTLTELSEAAGLLAPMANYFKDTANGVSTIKNVSPEASSKFGEFVDKVTKMAEEAEKVTLQKLVTSISDLVQQIIIADSYSSNLSDFAAVLHDVYIKGSDLQYVVAHMESINGVLKSVKDDARDAGVNFTSFANYMKDSAETFKQVDFTHISEQLYLLINPIKDLVAYKENVYQLAYAIGTLGDKWGGIKTLADYFTDLVNDIITLNTRSKMATENTQAFIDALVEASVAVNNIHVDDAARMFETFGKRISDAMAGAADSFDGVGRAMASNLIGGVKAYWKEAYNAGNNLAGEFKKGVDALNYKLQTAGENAGKAIVLGLRSYVRRAYDAGVAIGKNMEKGAKDALQIHSPSKVFYDIARYCLNGFVKGVEDNTGQAHRQVKRAFNYMIKDLKKSGLGLDELGLDLGIKDYKSMKAARAEYEKYSKLYTDILKKRKESKVLYNVIDSSISKMLNKQTATRRTLTKEEGEALNLLQERLNKTGTLSDMEAKRMASLLGFNKEETAQLNSLIAKRKEISNIIDQQTHVAKGYKKIMKEAEEASTDENTKAAQKELDKYEKRYNKVLKRRREEKKEVKDINKHLFKQFSKAETNRKYLTKNQKIELAFLQKKLSIEGTLTDKEFKRMARLLGFYQEQDEKLNEELAKRKELEKQIDKDTDKLYKYKDLISSISAEIESGKVYSFGPAAEAYDKIAKSLYAYGQALYENTQEYADNTAQIETNRKNIDALQGSIDELNKKKEDELSVIEKSRMALYDMLSTGELNLKYKEKDGKLTKESKKQREEDIKSLERLQGKLKENGKLSAEEYRELARLLGLKGKNLLAMETEIKTIEEYDGYLKQTNSDLADANAAVDELTDANKDLAAAIEDGPVAMLAELHDRVLETITEALDPLKESLEDNISMLDKFSVTELDEKFDISKIIGNAASFGNIWAQWEKDFDQFLTMGFSDEVEKYVESLGPAAANLLKVLLTASDAEVSQINDAFMSSQEAEIDQWLTKIEKKAEDVQKFYDNLKILRDAGLSYEAYKAFVDQGYEAAGAIVDGLISGLNTDMGKFNIDRVNEAYATLENVPKEIADQVMVDAAAAFEGVGGYLYDALIAGMSAAYDGGKGVATMREALQKFVNDVYAPKDDPENPTSETNQEVNLAGTTTGETYIDGMTTGIDNNAQDVVNSAEDMASDANAGTQVYLSYANGEEIGAQMDAGLIAGLEENGGAVAAAATAVAYQAYAAAMAALAIASPSKKFAEIGMYADLGFAQGLIAYTSRVTDATTVVAESSLDTMRSKLSELSDSLSSEANAPVIRPILDLSGVEAGAATVKRMFDSTHVGGGFAMGDEEAVLAGSAGNSYVFNQYNNSPKALSRIDIYRATNNQFAMFRRATT